MNAKSLMAVAFSSLFPLAVSAHDCSGGADGGMDATGNQCSDALAARFSFSDGAAATSTRPTKLDADSPVDVSSQPARQEAGLVQLTEQLRASAEATRKSAQQSLADAERVLDQLYRQRVQP